MKALKDTSPLEKLRNRM